MQRVLRGGLVAAAIVAAGAVSSFCRPAPDQNGRYVPPRLVGSSHPDLNGVWQAMNTAYWDIQDHSAQAGPVLALGLAAGFAALASVTSFARLWTR